MSLDLNNLYPALLEHRGHLIGLVSYGDEDRPHNIAIRCETCGVVLLDADRENGKRPFTVIGIYEENYDRWADVIWADSGAQAADIAHDNTGGDVTVAGVVEGNVEVVA